MFNLFYLFALILLSFEYIFKKGKEGMSGAAKTMAKKLP